jgi:type III pantothenate kinase
MLLALDVGNTNTKFAMLGPDEDRPAEPRRVRSARERTPDEWQALMASLLNVDGRRLDELSDVVIASVVPAVTRALIATCRDRLRIEPVVLTSEIDVGLRVATDAPAETGIDRVMNGLAAFHRLGGPVVVVDCGTATKFDAVTADGAFVGGAIGPGLEAMLDALAGRAARLYAVELAPPVRAIGTNTVASIQSGLVLGFLSLCEGMIRRVADEIGAERVIATGGGGEFIAAQLSAVTQHVPGLTLEGIVAAYRWRVSRH